MGHFNVREVHRGGIEQTAMLAPNPMPAVRCALETQRKFAAKIIRGQGETIPNTERTASPYVLTSEGLRQHGGIMLVVGQVTYLAIFFALACFVAARYCNRRDIHQPEEQPEVRGLAPEVLAS